jgi:hypothetical protein
MVALPLPRMYGGNPLQSISQSGADTPQFGANDSLPLYVHYRAL